MKTKCSYSDYLKTLPDSQILRVWNDFCDKHNTDRVYSLIYDKDVFEYFPLNEMITIIINGEVNPKDKYFSFDGGKMTTFSTLTDEKSPIDFEKLSKWITDNKFYEKFCLNHTDSIK